ncbi:Protein required for attachment to host cells [Paracoccus alcaliphilus]|uniref:Protein required for attachment to host cells n=1 Tax=Paracoccus alcaliphilus TaxID=34002 RepID=A0A1H8J166_9RHOB|nr:host attachment protein [Paracoccus alcaliphilus]WCR16621.1 host attachment protein [Paracoccus alcaliphilus]SEN74135.1 Protein required for attachment to host cells [Paracoccus alcaliphilus]
MISPSLARNALVVVADGHMATLLRNRARNGVTLKQTGQLTQQDLTDGELVENSSRDIDEAAFAARLADYLNGLVLKQKVEELAIIADPSTLGEMRKKYHKELEQRLKQEVAKNLTNADLKTIEAALQ